jgi:anthraniloyl-CoA monooxygenase
VKVFVLGAGPAGLYLSLLLKKADPSHEVVVVERNPPDATYGFGVVFSEQTLHRLEEADAPTYREITSSFANWDAIHIHYRDRLIVSRGHAFSGLARKLLLEILQRRCRELGVEMRFQTEAPDLGEAGGYDLVVGADGANSTVRRLHERQIRPSIEIRRAKYVWYGTTRRPDAFTFIFKETPYGMFQVHSYPYDAGRSTVIVECHEEIWRRAGLDQMDESQSLRFCEGLFVDFLQGHPLLSNRSLWVSFPMIRCRTWSAGNVVLLGDAVHTAHFSIGSGTKLAMEDAIELARALGENRRLPAALAQFEDLRRPVVERTQQAARESLVYFEDVGRYSRFEPVQFAFNLLTRSGRITYTKLKERDPELVREVEVLLSGRERRPSSSAFELDGLTLANRLAAQLGDRVEAALLLTPVLPVSPEGRITVEDPPAHPVPAAGAALGVRLGHAGRRGATRPRHEGLDRPLRQGAWTLLAASAIPYTRWSARPKEMDEQDMERVQAAFVAAARQAAVSEAALLDLHMAHGYLLGSFLSPLANRRSDGFGGSLDNRLRFPLGVVAAVRVAWPRVLMATFNADDCLEGGITPDEGVEMARRFKAAGCDMIQPVSGQSVPEAVPSYRPGFQLQLADRVRNEAFVPVLASGHLGSLDLVDTAVAAGRADLCLLEPPV